MPELIASGQLPLYDYNDAIIAGAAPVNPSPDTLWLDSSVTPNMMKRWDGLAWEPVGELDPTYSETITAIETTLANMADDGLLDYSDRQKLKEDIALITGAIPADTGTLPTGATLDDGTVGSYRRLRKAAISAGMLTSNAAYTTLATAYTTLSAFLNARTPKPWDVSLTNKATPTPVDKATFRNAWLGYYNAEAALADETTATLSSGIRTLKDTTNDQIAASNTNINNLRQSLDSKRDIRLGMKLGFSDFSTVNANYIYLCGLTTNATTFVEELSNTDGSLYDRGTQTTLVIPKQALNLTGLVAGISGYLVWNSSDGTNKIWFITLQNTYDASGTMTASKWMKRNIGVTGDNTEMILTDAVYVLGELEI